MHVAGTNNPSDSGAWRVIAASHGAREERKIVRSMKLLRKSIRIDVKVNCISTVICIIGCCCHLVVMNIDYFEYKTVAMYAPYIPLKQTLPSESLCFVMNSHSSSNFTFIAQETESEPIMSVENVIINVSSVVSDCHMRNMKSGQVEAITDCSTLFNATRSTRLNYYNCYTLNLLNKMTYSSLESAAAMVDKDTFCSFSLTDNLTVFNRMMLLLHFQVWPYEELFYSSELDTSSQPKKYLFRQTYEIFEFIRLSRPYDTACIEAYPSLCSSNDRIQHSICSRNLCHQSVVVTYNVLEGNSVSGIKIKVKLMSTPVTRVKYVESLRFDSFFIQVSSVLGLWCSLSINFITQNAISALKRKVTSRSRDLSTRWFMKIVKMCRVLNINLFRLNTSAKRKLIISRHIGWKRRSLQLTIKLITLLLFARELTFISIDYFQYKTKMRINLQINAEIKVPDISHCVDMYQWFNLTKPRYEFELYDRTMTQFTHNYNYTLKDLFDSTPNVNSMMHKCRIRTSLTSPLVTEHTCNQYFTVSKYFQDEFICYLIQPNLQYHLDGRVTRERENNPNIVYSIVPHTILGRIVRIQPIVSYGYPSKSRFLANRLFKEAANELVVLSFFIYKYSKLPAPYDTDCSLHDDQDDCRIKCMNFSRIGVAPYSELHIHPIDKPLIDYIDLKNHSFAEIVKNLEIECSSTCKDLCEDAFAKTTQQVIFSSKESLELALASPKYPLYQFNAVPVYTLYMYLYQMTCCASFWIGFSLLNVTSRWWTRGKTGQKPRRMEYLCALTEQLDKVMQRLLISKGCKESKGKYVATKALRVSKRLFYFILLSIGFLCHSFNTAKYYFEYPSRMDTRLRFESNFTDLRATICITFDQLNLQGDYSLRNIWAKSPRVDEIMLECGHRGFDLLNLSHLPRMLKERIIPYINSSSLCNSLFTVRKMVSLAMVCYESKPNIDTNDAEFNGKYHLLSSKVYLFFTFRQVFSRYNLTVAISQGPAQVSLLFTSTLPSTGPAKCLWYWISYFKYIITSLPYPYQMNIYNGLKQLTCVRKCVNTETATELSRLSSYGEVDRVSDRLHETVAQSVSQDSLAIRERCEMKCFNSKRYKAIRKSYYETYHEGPYEDAYDKAENGTNGLWFRNSDYLVPHTHFFPSLRLLDLVLYTGTIYSIWFGMSALQTTDFLFVKPPASSLSSIDRRSLCLKYKNLTRSTAKNNHLLAKDPRNFVIPTLATIPTPT